jgi:outer membrane protein assembly factor BamB
MGVSKQPVVVLNISPNPVCLGQAVSWSMVGSYAPGSTIVSYAIDMDDGTQYFVSSGTHTYGAVGTYDVVATVTEGTGLSQTVTKQVEVIDCDDALLITFAYAATDGDGVWFIDFTDSAPAWVQRNDGLVGTALNVNSITLRPGDKRLPDTVHELWAATDGGVYFTRNGGRLWKRIVLPDPSNAEFGDAPATTVDQLTFHDVVYSHTDPDLLWVLAARAAVSRLWEYRTDDSGLNWISRGLLT